MAFQVNSSILRTPTGLLKLLEIVRTIFHFINGWIKTRTSSAGSKSPSISDKDGS